MDLEKADSLPNLKDIDEVGVEGNSCVVRHKRKLGCCAFTVFLILFFFTGFWVKFTNSNDGTECPLPDNYDNQTWSNWEQQSALPDVKFQTCANGTSSTLSQVRTRGDHNSYKLYNKPEPWLIGLNRLVPQWKYTKPPLVEQLDEGRRNFELDLHFGEDGRVPMIFHLPVLDQETVCYCLSSCLAQMKTWSDANPTHLPVTVYFDVKVGHRLEDWRAYNNFITEENLVGVDHLIRSIFPRNQVVVPDDLRRGSNETSLKVLVESRGWPTVESTRGKFIFAFMEKGGQKFRKIYATGDHKLLEERAVFLMDVDLVDIPETDEEKTAYAALETDHVAMVKVDNVAKSPELTQLCAEFVKKGYLLRSWGSGANIEDYEEALAETKEILVAGSQIVSMDSQSILLWNGLFSSKTPGACGLPHNTCSSKPCQASDLTE